jgi:hypothetical protein
MHEFFINFSAYNAATIADINVTKQVNDLTSFSGDNMAKLESDTNDGGGLESARSLLEEIDNDYSKLLCQLWTAKLPFDAFECMAL